MGSDMWMQMQDEAPAKAAATRAVLNRLLSKLKKSLNDDSATISRLERLTVEVRTAYEAAVIELKAIDKKFL